MKSIYKSFLVIFFFLSCSNSFASNIAFIDLDFVVENTNVGKDILKELNNLNTQNIKKLKLIEEDLKLKEEEIKKKQNIISEDEYSKEINLLKDKIKTFRNEKNMMVSNFNNEKNQKIKNGLQIKVI